MIVMTADDRRHHAADEVEHRQAQAEYSARALGVDRVANAIDDLVVVLEPAERAAPRW